MGSRVPSTESYCCWSEHDLKGQEKTIGSWKIDNFEYPTLGCQGIE